MKRHPPPLLTSPVLTLGVDLRLVGGGRALRQVSGAQVPHVHALGSTGGHGGAQGRGLGHGWLHWAVGRERERVDVRQHDAEAAVLAAVEAVQTNVMFFLLRNFSLFQNTNIWLINAVTL